MKNEKDMKTGIELILQERKEQIEKHGWSLDHDASYADGQLEKAAIFCQTQANIKLHNINGHLYSNVKWPDGWIKSFEDKIRNKPVIDQLTVCGAFYIAEYDRTHRYAFLQSAFEVASKIDYLLNIFSR